MVLASVTGSDSAGSATAVASLIRDVTTAAVARRDPRVEGPQVAVVGQRRVAGAAGEAASRLTGMWVCSGT